MTELNFFIPITGKDGRTYTDAQHAEFERAALERFDSLALRRGAITRNWTDSQSVAVDRFRVYAVLVNEEGDVEKVAELMEVSYRLYGQVAVLVKRLSKALEG